MSRKRGSVDVELLRGNICNKERFLVNWRSQSCLHGLNNQKKSYFSQIQRQQVHGQGSSRFSVWWGPNPLPGSQMVFLYVKGFSEFSFIRALTSFMSLTPIQLPKAPTLNNITLEVRFRHMHLGVWGWHRAQKVYSIGQKDTCSSSSGTSTYIKVGDKGLRVGSLTKGALQCSC